MESFRETLYSFRQQRLLCDVTIRSMNGEHHAHKVMLAAASNFFKAMFINDFLEARSGVIKLDDLESDVIDALLKYIYTGKLDIDASNSFEMYCIADRLDVIDLKRICVDFLVKVIDVSNCLSIMRLGQSVSDITLEGTAFRYIVENFQDFSGVKDFLELTPAELTSFVKQDNLNIEKEEDLYQAMISWADRCPKTRDNALPDILAYVRFSLMSLEFLGKVIDSDRIPDEKWSATIFDIYQRSCRFHLRKEDDAFLTAPRHLPCYTRKCRTPSQLICVTGGWSSGRCLDVSEYYDAKCDAWVVTTKLEDPRGPRCYYGSAVNGRKIYFAGGYNGSSYLNTVRCFEPETNVWLDVSPMHSKRCFANLVKFQENIYAIAGFDGMKRLSSVERYCETSNQWTRVASLGNSRSDSAAVVCDDFIYVIGGYSGDSLRSVEYYDGEIWRYAAPLNEKRSGASAVTLKDGRIFVMGGYDGVARQRTTEFYDPKKNGWIFGPSMGVGRSNFATCIVRNYVYVIGGYTGQNTLRDVERYDVISNAWTAIAKLNFGRSAITANILRELPTAEELCDFLGKTQSQ